MLKKTATLLGWEAAVAFLLTILLLLFINVSCEKDATGPTADQGVVATDLAKVTAPVDVSDRWGEFSATILDNTGCKNMATDEVFEDITVWQSAIEWSYDGQGTLDLKHINAGFNCCAIPGCDVNILSRVIRIDESESFGPEGPCFCLCLFDVDYQITGLLPGRYGVFVGELYVNAGDEPLDFEITLKGTGSSGIFVVDREYYPWGE